MSAPPKADRLRHYLHHMLEALQRIERYCGGLAESAFVADPLVQDAVIRNLEVLGEASRNIERHAPAFARANPQLPLAAVYQMRNALAHGYFKVDLRIVWLAVQRDLPLLRADLEAALAALPPIGDLRSNESNMPE